MGHKKVPNHTAESKELLPIPLYLGKDINSLMFSTCSLLRGQSEPIPAVIGKSKSTSGQLITVPHEFKLPFKRTI